MASAAQSLRFATRNCRCLARSTSQAFTSARESRSFSTTCRYEARSGKKAKEESEEDFIGGMSLQLARQIRYDRKEWKQLGKEEDEENKDRKPPKPGFISLGEGINGKPELDLEDPEFEGDDITSIAHLQLDEHRERRNYLRIAAWEMPLLSELAKPFVPPALDRPLRFRYTTYLGEGHPSERKVVVEFCPLDVPNLTKVQRNKLKKLLGPRYNPETKIAKMSCEIYDHQAQNKRYLGDVINSLLREARNPNDTFEDIPIDTRHHEFKNKPRFPKEWRIDEKRQAELNLRRYKIHLLEEQKAQTGEMVDGVARIEAAFASPAEVLPHPLMVGAGQQGLGDRLVR